MLAFTKLFNIAVNEFVVKNSIELVTEQIVSGTDYIYSVQNGAKTAKYGPKIPKVSYIGRHNII